MVRLCVRWSPHEQDSKLDQFAAFGTNIHRYEQSDPESKSYELRNHWLLSSGENVQCFDWFPDKSKQDICAFGLSSRDVYAVCLNRSEPLFHWQTTYRVGGCNAVSFNLLKPNLLAAGLDKARNEMSCKIWDIQVSSEIPKANVGDSKHSEGTQSVQWFPRDLPGAGDCMVVGAKLRWLRIFDLRVESGSHTHKINAHNRCVKGCIFAPWNPFLLATWSEGKVKIWDLRMQKSELKRQSQPVHKIITQSKLIDCIKWLPTQPNVIATTCRKLSRLDYWSLGNNLISLPKEDSNEQREELESNVDTLSPFLTKQFRSDKPLLAADPHPRDPNRWIIASQSDKMGHREFYDINIQRASVAFSNDHYELCTGVVDGVPHTASLNRLVFKPTRSIRQRALGGYFGLNMEENVKSCQQLNLPRLAFFWEWLLHLRNGLNVANSALLSLIDKGALALLDTPDGSFGEPEQLTPASKTHPIAHYVSDARTQVLLFCHWFDLGPEGHSKLDHRCEQLEKKQEFSRSCFLAVTHLRIAQGIAALLRAHSDSQPSHHTQGCCQVLICLSGWNGPYQNADESKVWRDSADFVIPTLENQPYLCAILQFLKGDYEEVIRNPGLSLCDRVGVATRFLPLPTVKNFFARRLEYDADDFSVLLISGLGQHGLSQVQKNLDVSADIQTVALISCYVDVLFGGKSKWPCARYVQLYGDLLNRWQLWSLRCKFDHERRTLKSEYQKKKSERGDRVDRDRYKRPSVSPMIYARCQYCSEPLCTNPFGQSKKPAKRNNLLMKINFGGGNTRSGNVPKSGACPKCKRNLPRCSICLRRYDSPSIPTPVAPCWPDESVPPPEPAQVTTTDLKAEMPEVMWVSCLSCRHGGHAGHLLHYFESMSACPVSHCNCKCSLDFNIRSQY